MRPLILCTPVSHIRSKDSHHPESQVEKFEGFPVSGSPGGISPLQDKGQLRSNPQMLRFLLRERVGQDFMIVVILHAVP